MLVGDTMDSSPLCNGGSLPKTFQFNAAQDFL
jgi:hypothetical protein